MSINTATRLAARRGTGSDRLDIPVAGRSPLIAGRVDRETISRGAETIARFLGTGRYLAIQTCVVIVWIALNIALPLMRWDPYPFILLNLAFSTQAAYAAPLILLAQNRQDDRDRASLTEDRAAAIRMREDTEFLAREVAALRLAQSDAATRQYVRGELTNQLESLRGDIEALLRTALQPTAPTAQPLSATPNGSAQRPTRGGAARPSVPGTSTVATLTVDEPARPNPAVSADPPSDHAGQGAAPVPEPALVVVPAPSSPSPDGAATQGHLLVPARSGSRAGRKVPIRPTRPRIRDT
ncbi:DUF1003 domain-containing protein [Parafrankia discariae]|uniref:DUF1003 domain-containing protein n=1 Tax=Parafrankia discariae TaxID=365528 RepID=UPI000370EFF4|nr:DUF1003 domain-containing protein [Parafrankia discariae]